MQQWRQNLHQPTYKMRGMVPAYDLQGVASSGSSLSQGLLLEESGMELDNSLAWQQTEDEVPDGIMAYVMNHTWKQPNNNTQSNLISA